MFQMNVSDLNDICFMSCASFLYKEPYPEKCKTFNVSLMKIRLCQTNTSGN